MPLVRDVDAFALPLMNSQALLLGDRAEDIRMLLTISNIIPVHTVRPNS